MPGCPLTFSSFGVLAITVEVGADAADRVVEALTGRVGGPPRAVERELAVRPVQVVQGIAQLFEGFPLDLVDVREPSKAPICVKETGKPRRDLLHRDGRAVGGLEELFVLVGESSELVEDHQLVNELAWDRRAGGHGCLPPVESMLREGYTF